MRFLAGSGDVAGARTALEHLLGDATRYEADLDAFTEVLMAPSMPLAASERNSAYLDAHRARHRALEAITAHLVAGPESQKLAGDALRILEETQSLPARDAASSVQIRSVRRIPPRSATGDFRELDPVRVHGDDHPQDLGAPSADLIAFARTLRARSPAQIASWERSAIAIAPWHGEALGAAGCLRDRRCSSFDAAALLV